MATVGYYSMTAGQGSGFQVNEITQSGDTAVNVTVPNAAQLAGLDTLYVVNPSNSGFGAEYVNNLANIEAAVNAGMNLMIFDRTVTNAQTILPGAGSTITVIRDFASGTDVNVAAGAPASFTNGVNGTIDDATFDGGNFSNHGYVTLASLPPGSVPLLTTSDPNNIVAFYYPVGAGNVFYSTIPLDFYSNANFGTITPADVLTLFGNVETTLCFAEGTQIATPSGQQPIEVLKAGDMICIANEEPRKLRWIGMTHIKAETLRKSPNLRPVRITAGALGGGLPTRDLIVSRQHRMLVSSSIVMRMFGAQSVLVSAIKLTELPGIYVDEEISEVRYFHMLFDQHEIVLAEGAASESLFTGPQALASLPYEARAEVEALFPALTAPDYLAVPAVPIPSGRAQKQLVFRHAKNSKPLAVSAQR